MHSAKVVGKQMDSVYDLYLPEYTVPAPEVQTDFVEIIGRDGSIDKTAPDGVVRYLDRNWTLVFKKTGENVSANDVPSISSALMNDIHGRRGEVIFDDDANYKWIGRVLVLDVSCENNGLIIVTINFISEPYKYGINNISESVALSQTEQTIELENGRKPLVPTIVVSGDDAVANLSFTVKGVSHTATLSGGTWTVPDLVLFEGVTNLVATGSGTMLITYPEASL